MHFPLAPEFRIFKVGKFFPIVNWGITILFFIYKTVALCDFFCKKIISKPCSTLRSGFKYLPVFEASIASHSWLLQTRIEYPYILYTAWMNRMWNYSILTSIFIVFNTGILSYMLHPLVLRQFLRLFHIF